MSSNLKWEDHISIIVRKAYKKIWMLIRMKMNKVSIKDLLIMYTLKIRSIIENLAVVYAGSLTIEQSARLETVQKKCFRCILGSTFYKVPYEKLCEQLGMKTLAGEGENYV